jgi:hypothetical protein
METPMRLRDKRNSTDTPTTDISSVFDDSSPSSSSVSPVSSNGGDESYKEKEAPQQQPSVIIGIQNTTTKYNLDDYGTAASQRRQRRTTGQPRYSNFFSESRSQGVKDTQVPETPEIVSEHTSAAAQEPRTASAPEHEEQQLGNGPHQRFKRKQQASVSDVTSQPLRKKVKRNIQTTPAATRQLRKRKVDTSAIEEPQPPTKKVKTSLIKPHSTTTSKTKPQPKTSPAKAKDDIHPPRRITRGIARSRKPALQPADAAEVVPERDSLIAVLKMPPCWLLAERGDITPDAASMSHSTSTSTQQNASFVSTSNESVPDCQDQCAQPALAPVPASSQLSSSDVSQPAQPSGQPQGACITVEEPHQSLEEHELDIAFLMRLKSSQERLCEKPERIATQPEHSSPHLPAVATSEEQHVTLPVPSFKSTQTTQPWSKSFSPYLQGHLVLT